MASDGTKYGTQYFKNKQNSAVVAAENAVQRNGRRE